MQLDEFTRARQALAQGNLELAAQLCRELIARDNANAMVWGMLGHILHRQQHVDKAIAACQRACELDANLVPPRMELAQMAKRLGDQAFAKSVLQQLVQLRPQDIATRIDFLSACLACAKIEGNLVFAGLEFDRQINWLEKHATQSWEAQNTLGIVYLQRAQVDKAILSFHRATQIGPHAFAAWINLAELLIEQERYEQAREAAQHAVNLDLQSARALDALAWSSQKMSAPSHELLVLREKIVALEPTTIRLASLGHNLLKLGRFTDARLVFERCLEFDPDYLPAHWALFQYPKGEIILSDADIVQYLAQWEAGLRYFETIDSFELPVLNMLESCFRLNTNFYLHYTGVDVTALQIRYGKMIERVMQRLNAETNNRSIQKTKSLRPRIGFVSSHFRRHTVYKLFGPMIRSLANSEFDVFIYHLESIRHPELELLEGLGFTTFTFEQSPKKWADQIRADQLDLLVYLDIGMHPTPQILAAQRLATVQAMWWGHPVSFGASCMDYFLSSELMEPEDGSHHYAEKLVRLPNLGIAFEPPDRLPAEVSSFAPRASNEVRFFLGQSASKLLPLHDNLLGEIVNRVPHARIHMIPHFVPELRAALSARIRASFEARGLDYDRHIVMHPFQSEENFLGLAQSSDINLDSLLWSGGNTSLEITWCDVPSVSLPGKFMRARHTYAILRMMGLDELIARDQAHYLDIVERLALDLNWRAEVKLKLQKNKHKLYRDQAAIDGFHLFLREKTPRQE